MGIAAATMTSEGEYKSVKLSKPGTNKTPLLKSAIIRTIPAWNSLPGSISSSTSTVSFKSGLVHGQAHMGQMGKYYDVAQLQV